MTIVRVFTLYIFIIIGAAATFAQQNMIFSFKAENFAGKTTDGGGYNAGIETALELPLLGDHNWEYTYNFPRIGFALGGFKTQNFDHIDPVIYTYPYLLYPIINKPGFQLNLKGGLGIATYMHTGDSISGRVFPVTFIWNGGLFGDIALGKKYGKRRSQWILSIGLSGFMLHNAHITREAENFIMMDGVIGIKYTPNVNPLPIYDKPKKVKRILALEGSLQGGVNQLEREDNLTYYPNASLNCGFYLPITNAWRVGLGADGMYNTAYDGTQRVTNTRYNFIKEKDPMTMFRAGAFLANDFSIDRFVVGAHIGLYVYTKIKLPDNATNKSENFMYQKLVTKYRITKNVFATFQVKTHLKTIECAEMGLGLAMPDFGRKVKNPFARISFKKENMKEYKIEDNENYVR